MSIPGFFRLVVGLNSNLFYEAEARKAYRAVTGASFTFLGDLLLASADYNSVSIHFVLKCMVYFFVLMSFWHVLQSLQQNLPTVLY